MKIFMYVYNFLETDARVQRSAEVLCENNELTLVGLKDEYENKKYNIIKINLKKKNHFHRYLEFCKNVTRTCMKNNYDIIYAHDLYSAIPFLYFKKRYKKTIFIYDCHETIFPQKNVKFTLRDYFFYFFDRLAIKQSNYVICAQKDRAIITKKKFNLKVMPVVINNISILKNNKLLLDDNIQIRLNNFFKRKGLKIIYTGGINEDRNILTLIEVIKNTKYNLLLIGYGNIFNLIESKIIDEHIENIYLINKIKYSELGQIVCLCDIGYVSYNNNDINNRYCASNKIYEYTSMNLAILSTPNKTINEIINEYNIGFSSENILEALVNIENNIEKYKFNTTRFNNENNWEVEKKKLLGIIDKIKEAKNV